MREGKTFVEETTGFGCVVLKVTQDYVVWNYCGFHKEPNRVYYFDGKDAKVKYRDYFEIGG